MNNIIIYTKNDCPFCVKAKELFSQKNELYTEVRLGEDIRREDFMSIFPEVRTVPFIIINGEKVGGYDRLVEYYNSPDQQFLAE
jgi:glutaredoxin 3